MRPLSRRSILSSAPVVAAGGLLVAVGSAVPAVAEPTATEKLDLVAARAKSTLPNVPVLGTTFAMLLELYDPKGAVAGDGSVTGSVVNITADTPPKIVVQSHIVLRFPFKGELHLSTMHVRVLPSPIDNPVSIIGGTGTYANARGDGTLNYPNLDRVNISLTVNTS